jgi:hypothetical protein
MKSQLLDGNEGAHSMEEGSEHLLEDLRTFAADGTFSRVECRHAMGHAALLHSQAEDQCSIMKWAWASLMKIERMIEGYRLRVQTKEKAVRQTALS